MTTYQPPNAPVRRLSEHLVSVVASLLPASTSLASPEERRQGSVLLGLVGLMSLCAALYIPTFALLGLDAYARLSVALLISVLGSGWLYKRTGARLASSQAVLASIFVVLVLGCLSDGISQTLVLPWLMVVPVYGALLLGLRRSIPWLLLTCLAFGLLCGLNTEAWLSSGSLVAAPHSLYAMALRVGLTLVLTGVAWTYDLLRQQAQREQAVLTLAVEDARCQADQDRAVAQAAHATARSLLDHVDSAILMVDAAGAVGAEQSTAAGEILGEIAPGKPIWTVFQVGNPHFADWLETCWESAQADWMPLDLSLLQLPEQVSFGDRHLAISLRVLDPEQPSSAVLLVAHDVTAAVIAAAEQQAQRDVANLMARSLSDPHLVTSFVNESSRLVVGVGTANWPVADQRRALHTLKGSSAVLGLTGLAAWLHGAEDRVSPQAGASLDDRNALLERWARIVQPLQPLLNHLDDGEVLIPRVALAALADQVRAHDGDDAVLAAVLRLSWEPARLRLDHLASGLLDVAARTGLAQPRMEISCSPQLRLPPSPAWAAVWLALSHVLRNALAHGLETPEERQRLGKDPVGCLVLSMARVGAEVVVEVRDDGRGIDWSAVAERARKLRLPCSNQIELEHALFADGLSTAAELTELSGRGVGLSAFLHAVQQLDGRVQIDSSLGSGSTVRALVPVVKLHVRRSPDARSRATDHPAEPSQATA